MMVSLAQVVLVARFGCSRFNWAQVARATMGVGTNSDGEPGEKPAIADNKQQC